MPPLTRWGQSWGVCTPRSSGFGRVMPGPCPILVPPPSPSNTPVHTEFVAEGPAFALASDDSCHPGSVGFHSAVVMASRPGIWVCCCHSVSTILAWKRRSAFSSNALLYPACWASSSMCNMGPPGSPQQQRLHLMPKPSPEVLLHASLIKQYLRDSTCYTPSLYL